MILAGKLGLTLRAQALRNRYVRGVEGWRVPGRGASSGRRRQSIPPQSGPAVQHGRQDQSHRTILRSTAGSRRMGVVQDLPVEFRDGAVPWPHGIELG